ncbi:hypothetical protein SAMN04488519_104161 [Algoriphagus ornithinivorans]|uniref:Uncharacterized protein n=1 Tax=Algoriphagus ornithinivorans TaxID=226506 RepID=A0A1I5F0V2_9BACT|nr:hypothetical protein SAMN04488519_104161 [Algoriphagus ornithinivorans]
MYGSFRVAFLSFKEHDSLMYKTNQLTTKWLNPSITASETGGIKMHKYGASQL